MNLHLTITTRYSVPQHQGAAEAIHHCLHYNLSLLNLMNSMAYCCSMHKTVLYLVLRIAPLVPSVPVYLGFTACVFGL